jgi:chemotaxis protein MotB
MAGSEHHHDEAPVIRIVKKSHHEGHHGGAWKVAYADFVTAMMALFIVLWILGQDESVQKSVASYFKDPTGKSLIMSGGGGVTKAATMPLRNESGTSSSMMDMKSEPLQVLEEEAEKLRTMIETEPDLKTLAGQISVEVTPEGVRVEINESEKHALFESGSAKLEPKLVEALRVLGGEYRKLSTSVVVEGHTDSAPYAPGSSMTNWELATYRANEARRVLMEGGLHEEQIFMVRGFADRKPRFSDAGDPRNRRISMLLLSPEGLRIAGGSNYTRNNGHARDTTAEGPIP